MFQLRGARFRFDDGREKTVRLMAEKIDVGTHITLLMGVNGTSKSRILASCAAYVTAMLENERSAGKTAQKRLKIEQSSGFSCVDVSLGFAGTENDYPFYGFWGNYLPTKVLAISNLVRDRFHFSSSTSNSSKKTEEYYKYLGVRQGTNLTTTGAMDRTVSEAFLALCEDEEKFRLFKEWIGPFFPAAEIAIGFQRISRDELNSISADPRGSVEKRIARRRGGFSTRNLGSYTDALITVINYHPLNIVLACSTCNSDRKQTFDPVAQKGRSYKATKFNIVHPYLDKPDEHLFFEGAEMAVLVRPVNASQKGAETIRLFDLASPERSKERAKDLLFDDDLSHLHDSTRLLLELTLTHKAERALRPKIR
ncbi:hypothetical protein [Ferrovibrio sp.]|uniref:hypothetical protein n=1 Tax=Ferrovibrio sp. TaxID=1917215 RepID=UPI0025C4465A|nr:hypothetical protein [Ferrovibrio sp.]